MYNQALKVGVEWKFGEVQAAQLEGQPKTLQLRDGVIEANSVILATGAKPRRLGVPGETELAGRGVSYCATCDGAFFEDLDVIVIGGGDSAVKEALFRPVMPRQSRLFTAGIPSGPKPFCKTGPMATRRFVSYGTLR